MTTSARMFSSALPIPSTRDRLSSQPPALLGMTAATRFLLLIAWAFRARHTRRLALSNR
ncbi:hypothetical protein BDZ89DRAFT_1078246 [Hymenopellis radicata]|nr:hypothetical protein BDZ89DRAFT_1078246 [Hymenopellis radicata]